jgi:hypothetical protein
MLAIGWAISEAGLHLGEIVHELASRGRGKRHETVREDHLEKVEQRAREIAPNWDGRNGLRVRNAGPQWDVRMVRNERDIDITLTCGTQRI